MTEKQMTVSERIEACAHDSSVRAPRLTEIASFLRARGYDVRLRRCSRFKQRRVDGELRRGVKEYRGRTLKVFDGSRLVLQHDTTTSGASNLELVKRVRALLTELNGGA